MEAEIKTTVERYRKDTKNMKHDKITIDHDLLQVSKNLIRLPVIKPLWKPYKPYKHLDIFSILSIVI